jgi:hypothetical protein
LTRAGRQPHRAHDDPSLHDERQLEAQTAPYRLVQRPAGSFIGHAEASANVELLPSIKDGFDAFLERGIWAHGFPGFCCRTLLLD